MDAVRLERAVEVGCAVDVARIAGSIPVFVMVQRDDPGQGRLHLRLDHRPRLLRAAVERADQPDPKLYHSPERLVVAELDKFRIVFPVTEVMGSIRFNKKHLQEVPVIVSHARAAFTRGIITYNNKDIGLLDESVLFPEFLRQLA